ncbi:unnamed protein product [Dovyalis caffra]|uniref:Uncharacterized protein n=1 Tax=Dovyalis caffra TaxID=77055 RepID=A0AAV1R8B4_9ROSI|nr:unnamed protein product [Dovyalis caffra]
MAVLNNPRMEQNIAIHGECCHTEIATYRLLSFHEYATLAMSLPLMDDSATETELSTTLGTPRVAFGLGTKVDKADLLRASYVHYFDHEKKVAAAAVICRKFSTKEDSLIVGG